MATQWYTGYDGNEYPIEVPDVDPSFMLQPSQWKTTPVYYCIYDVRLACGRGDDMNIIQVPLCGTHLQSEIQRGDVLAYSYAEPRTLCDMCEGERASYEAEKRAEERNEAILHFGRVDY